MRGRKTTLFVAQADAERESLAWARAGRGRQGEDGADELQPGGFTPTCEALSTSTAFIIVPAAMSRRPRVYRIERRADPGAAQLFSSEIVSRGILLHSRVVKGTTICVHARRPPHAAGTAGDGRGQPA